MSTAPQTIFHIPAGHVPGHTPTGAVLFQRRHAIIQDLHWLESLESMIADRIHARRSDLAELDAAVGRAEGRTSR